MQTSSGSKQTPQYPLESVDRAFRLLLMFREHQEIRLSQVRDELEVGQSTAHRLMAMLVYHGFAAQDPVTRVYRAGPALYEIGLSVVSNMDIRSVARPVLEKLAAVTGETVHLGVLEGTEVRFVDAVESELALRVSARVGKQVPAHATSLGKAMLAALTDEQVRMLYPSESLPVVTAQTMSRRSDLLAELDRTRARGYACNAGESEQGVGSTGVAIMHPARGPVGAITIAAPLTRLDQDKTERHAALLVEASREITAQLG
jgi:IclR family transcriptional regulator, acetate operon repressor